MRPDERSARSGTASPRFRRRNKPQMPPRRNMDLAKILS